MDINRATELLLALADGIDPITGNRLPDESVYNNPEIIRAIHCLLRQLQARTDSAAAVNAGRSWHADEERQLREEYDAGLSVDEIARRHGRSPGAIEARLSELGRRDQIQFSMHCYQNLGFPPRRTLSRPARFFCRRHILFGMYAFQYWGLVFHVQNDIIMATKGAGFPGKVQKGSEDL